MAPPPHTQTCSNEADIQLTILALIHDRVRRHKSSALASIIEAIGQLKKGASVMMLSAKIMSDRITSLERANVAATKRKQRKKKWIQHRGTLIKGEGEDVLA